MKQEESDNPYKEEFLEIKGRCKSRAKKNFWGGLAAVLFVILLLLPIVYIIYNKGIPHLQNIVAYVILIAGMAAMVFAGCWWALNNYRFLKNVDGLDTPDQLLYWHEKKILNERKIGFLCQLAIACNLIVNPFFYDPDPWIISLFAFIAIALFAFLIYKYKKGKTYYDSRPNKADKEITEQLQKLIEQM